MQSDREQTLAFALFLGSIHCACGIILTTRRNLVADLYSNSSLIQYTYHSMNICISQSKSPDDATIRHLPDILLDEGISAHILDLK